MISVDNLAVEFNGSTLFKDVSFVINETDKIALMGKNGAGKSTLLKVIAGIEPPEGENQKVWSSRFYSFLFGRFVLAAAYAKGCSVCHHDRFFSSTKSKTFVVGGNHLRHSYLLQIG